MLTVTGQHRVTTNLQFVKKHKPKYNKMRYVCVKYFYKIILSLVN